MEAYNFIRFFLVLLFGFYDVSAVVFELENSNFDETVKGNALVMVMFYAPWCGACKKLLPVLSEVSTMFEHHENVIFARVNAYEERILALRFDINQFPTILNFPFDTKPSKYTGRIVTEDLRQVIRGEVLMNEALIKKGERERGETPIKPKVMPKMQQNIKEISLDDFKDVALDRTKHAFVSLYAPGCTDGCYVFAQVAESYKNEDSIVFVSMDFTTDMKITQTFNVIKNPTFYWYPKSDKEVGSRYGGGFDALETLEFINTETGMGRELGGQLKPGAGRVPNLDQLIKGNLNDILTGTRMGSIIAQAKNLAANSIYEERYTRLYIDILEKIEGGQEVEDVIQAKYDLINNKMEHATTKKENEELIKKRNIIGVFVDVASEHEHEQKQKFIDLPKSFHDEL